MSLCRNGEKQLHRLRFVTQTGPTTTTRPLAALSTTPSTRRQSAAAAAAPAGAPTSPSTAYASLFCRHYVSVTRPLSLGEVSHEWVPPAYRGAPSSFPLKKHRSGGRPDPRSLRGRGGGRPSPSNNHQNTKRAGIPSNRYPPYFTYAKRKEFARQKAVKAEAQKDLDRFGVLSGEAQRMLLTYRSALNPSSNFNDSESIKALKLSVDAPANSHTRRVNKVMKRLTDHVDAFGTQQEIPSEEGVGESETAAPAAVPVDIQRLTETDDLFRGVCRVLQDMVRASCKVYNHESQREALVFLECAETCLRALKELRLQRAAHFDRLQRAVDEKATDQAAASKSTASSWMSPLKAVATYISEGFSKLTHRSNPGFDVDNSKTNLAHKDSDLGPTLDLVRTVVESLGVASASESAKIEETEKKVTALLNILPDDVKMEARTLLNMLEILCHAGTLEAARECERIYRRYSQEFPHLPFSLVLRGYLEASRRETILERKREIVQEILGVLKVRWDSDFPNHKMERIAQSSSVLHCIAVSGVTKDDPEIIREADLVYQKTANASSRKAWLLANGKLDPDLVPLVNYLACVYASSGDAKKVEEAKSMVRRIIPRHTDSRQEVGRYIKYPNVETINTLLEGILKLHQDRTEGLDSKADLSFADLLLNFAMSRRETGIWADTRTFDLIMNLYTILKPPDVGKRMEDLVSNYETRIYFSKKSDMHISLATYNRVIWGLWEEAKEESSCRTSQRALALLDKLEMLSTPLLLTRRQVLAMEDINLYQFGLRPSSKTYELVLSVCADTANPSEVEMAAKVAYMVGRRLLQIDRMKTKASVKKVQTCLDRLNPDSSMHMSMKELLAKLEEDKAKQEEAA